MLYQSTVLLIALSWTKIVHIYVYSNELLIQEVKYKDQDHSSIQSSIFTSGTWYQIIV